MNPQLLHLIHLLPLIVPALGLSALQFYACSKAEGRPMAVALSWVILVWMVWMNWQVGLAVFLVDVVGCAVRETVKGDWDRYPLTDDVWISDWRQAIRTPVLLTLFVVMAGWMPQAWVWPLIGVLVGVPLFLALLVNSTGFRVGMTATLGVLTVLGACQFVLHLLPFIH